MATRISGHVDQFSIYQLMVAGEHIRKLLELLNGQPDRRRRHGFILHRRFLGRMDFRKLHTRMGLRNRAAMASAAARAPGLNLQPSFFAVLGRNPSQIIANRSLIGIEKPGICGD